MKKVWKWLLEVVIGYDYFYIDEETKNMLQTKKGGNENGRK
jgi:hypothetical protein